MLLCQGCVTNSKRRWNAYAITYLYIFIYYYDTHLTTFVCSRYSLDAQVATSDQSQVVRDVYKEIDDILAKNKNKKVQTNHLKK